MNVVLTLAKPDASEYDAYYQPYLDLVTETNVLQAMDDQVSELRETLDIDDANAAVVHPPYGWTIKQVVGHMIDNERVFGYRAARFATGDTTELPGYEQNDYVQNMDYEQPALVDLVEELVQIRQSNLMLFNRMSEDAWDRSGCCDGKSITVRAIACLQVAHLRHHLNIIKKRLA